MRESHVNKKLEDLKMAAKMAGMVFEFALFPLLLVLLSAYGLYRLTLLIQC